MTATGDSILAIRQSGSVATWTIQDAAARNGLGTSLAQALRTALDNLQQELPPPANWRDFAPPVRALVIQAAPIPSKSPTGNPVWIAGGNLKELANECREPERGRGYAQLMTSVIDDLVRLPVPVVVVADGAVIGGGAEFFLAGDLRLVSDRTTFSWRQLQAGLALGYGSTARLQAMVGRGWAQRLLLRGENICAETAAMIGLCHEVVPAAQLPTALEQLLAPLLELHAGSVGAQKAMGLSSGDCDDELTHFGRLWGNSRHQSLLDRFQS